MDTAALKQMLKKARQEKGLSQEALSDMSHVSLRTIQRIEKGTVKPRNATLQILAEKLELDFKELIAKEPIHQNYDEALKVLRRMNLVILLTTLIPFCNILFPLIIWKTNKRVKPLSNNAGMIVSFQVIWSISTFAISILSIFVHNLIFEDVGNAQYVVFIVYFVFVFLNISFLIWHTIKLTKEDGHSYVFAPNFF